MQVVTMHNNQTDEKHKRCNLRLNTATEHEETMSLGNVFQMLTIFNLSGLNFKLT